jgi:hypothetical protein
MNRITVFCLIGFSFLFSCEEGNLLDNMAPETKMFVDEINLSGELRLNSVVRLHWIGEDQDGYITHYELAINNGEWFETTATDSTFRFDIPTGSDTTDIIFQIRAIDNLGLADPTPAELIVPIKNTVPTARFDTLNTIPDSVFSVWSVLWEVEDLDGFETLDSIFLKVNDGDWVGLDRIESFVTFMPEAPRENTLQEAQIYSGVQNRFLPQTLPGLVVGAENRLYLRVRDIAGSFSEVDSSNSFFLKQQNNDFLVINAHGANGVEKSYDSILTEVAPNYDYLDLFVNIPPFWDPTFGFMLGLYDRVFWFGDDQQINSLGQQLLLEVAANQIQVYLNQGGKIFITTKFPNTLNDPVTGSSSPVFGFSPMDSLSSSSGQARISRRGKIFPLADFADELDTLIARDFLTSVDPFYPKNPINSIMNAEITRVNNWSGPETVCGRSVFNNGLTNQVFVSVELHLLSKDRAALEKFFDFVLNKEFNW